MRWGWWRRQPGRRRGNGLEAARAERVKSEERLEAVRRHVVRPIAEKTDRNQFADMIRATLGGNH